MELDWLSEELAEQVRRSVEAIVTGAGEQLVSIAVVGPAVDPPRHAHEPAPRLLVVLDRASVPVVANIGHQLQVLASPLPLTVLSEREIMRSGDVFSLELAEHRARHRLLWGRDPFGSVHFTNAELRLAIERELRLLERSLRDALVAGAVAEALAPAIDRLVVIAHHLTELAGSPPPSPREADVLAAAAGCVGIDVRPLPRSVETVRTGAGGFDPVAIVDELLGFVGALTRYADGLGVAGATAEGITPDT